MGFLNPLASRRPHHLTASGDTHAGRCGAARAARARGRGEHAAAHCAPPRGRPRLGEHRRAPHAQRHGRAPAGRARGAHAAHRRAHRGRHRARAPLLVPHLLARAVRAADGPQPAARQLAQHGRPRVEPLRPGLGLRGHPAQHDGHRAEAARRGLPHRLHREVGRGHGDAAAHAVGARLRAVLRVLPRARTARGRARPRAEVGDEAEPPRPLSLSPLSLSQVLPARERVLGQEGPHRVDRRGRPLPEPLLGPVRGELHVPRRRARRGRARQRVRRARGGGGRRPRVLRGAPLPPARARGARGARRGGGAALLRALLPPRAHAARGARELRGGRRRAARGGGARVRRRGAAQLLGDGELPRRGRRRDRRRARRQGHVGSDVRRVPLGQRRPALPAGLGEQLAAQGRQVRRLGGRRAHVRVRRRRRRARRAARRGVRPRRLDRRLVRESREPRRPRGRAARRRRGRGRERVLAPRGLPTLYPVEAADGLVWDLLAPRDDDGGGGGGGGDGGAQPFHPSLHLSEQALLRWPYKLVVGTQLFANHTGPLYPNCTTLTGARAPWHNDTKVFDAHVDWAADDGVERAHLWAADCGSGCLFDVAADPAERVDLAADPAHATSTLPSMRAELAALNADVFAPDRGGDAPRRARAGSRSAGTTARSSTSRPRTRTTRARSASGRPKSRRATRCTSASSTRSRAPRSSRRRSSSRGASTPSTSATRSSRASTTASPTTPTTRRPPGARGEACAHGRAGRKELQRDFVDAQGPGGPAFITPSPPLAVLTREPHEPHPRRAAV